MELSQEQKDLIDAELAADNGGEFDPEQLGDLVEQPVDPLDTPEVNQAAEDFTNAMRYVKGATKQLKRNQLARVFNAVLEFPLGNTYPKFKPKSAEDTLFIISLHALGAKNIMQNAIAANQELQQQMYKEIVDGVADEVTQQKANKDDNEGEL